MLEKFKKLPLRKGVGIVLLNQNNEVFVAKRIDNPNNYWQMPQGGIDENEEYLDAATRELEEETSITNVKLIKELDGFQTYLLPQNLLGIIWKGKYKGQIQKWFCMRFLGSDKEIKKDDLSSMINEANEALKDENLDDQKRFIANQKIDVLNRLN